MLSPLHPKNTNAHWDASQFLKNTERVISAIRSFKVQYGVNQEINCIYKKNLLRLDTIVNTSNSNMINMKI